MYRQQHVPFFTAHQCIILARILPNPSTWKQEIPRGGAGRIPGTLSPERDTFPWSWDSRGAGLAMHVSGPGRIVQYRIVHGCVEDYTGLGCTVPGDTMDTTHITLVNAPLGAAPSVPHSTTLYWYHPRSRYARPLRPREQRKKQKKHRMRKGRTARELSFDCCFGSLMQTQTLCSFLCPWLLCTGAVPRTVPYVRNTTYRTWYCSGTVPPRDGPTLQSETLRSRAYKGTFEVDG